MLAAVTFVAMALSPSLASPASFQVGVSPTANNSAKPAGCARGYDRATFHRFARTRAFDGRYRVSKFERETLDRIIRCQVSSSSKPILRKHRSRYAASHTRKLFSQGIGKLNRVWPAHGLFDTKGRKFIRFGAVRRIFEAVDATPAEAYEFAGIVRGESGGGRMGGYPGILGIDGMVVPGATSIGIGLTQTTPAVWCCAALDVLRQLGGAIALRNPFVNARMSMALYQFAGNSFGPWYGTRYLVRALSGVRSALTAADRRWLKAGGLLRLRAR